MFYQIFLSPQVKRCASITYKHGIHKLTHEFPNDLRLKKLLNIKKVSKFRRNSLVPSLPAKMKILLILSKKTLGKQKLNFYRRALFHMKTRVSLRYFIFVSENIFLFLTCPRPLQT